MTTSWQNLGRLGGLVLEAFLRTSGVTELFFKR